MTTSETGYDKNLSLFEQLLAILKESTSNYVAPVAILSIANLESRVAPMQTSLQQTKEKLAVYTLAVNARQSVYEEMEKRITRAFDLLPVLGIDVRTTSDLKSAYDKVKGYTANSEQGFENLKKNFDRFVELLKLTPAYLPTDSLLQVEALEVLSELLDTRNKAVIAADSALSSARIVRNELMYQAETGIVPVCRLVKQYYRSQEGVNGITYKRLVALLKPLR